VCGDICAVMTKESHVS